MEFLGGSGWFVGIKESERVFHEEELEFLEPLPLTALTAFRMMIRNVPALTCPRAA
jgi:hypothetical protein